MTLVLKNLKSLKTPRKQVKVREKLRFFGAENLTNVELLAVVFGSGQLNLPVMQLAAAVLAKFPLTNLHRQSLLKLQTIHGIGPAKAAQLMAALELGRRNQQPVSHPIKNPTAVLPHVDAIRRLHREHTVCLYLNARHELIHQETVAVGGLNYSLLEARDVFAPAIRLPAVSIIMVHNHPSGSNEPSQEDLTVTNKLAEAGKLLGITLLDHLIVTRRSYCSLREKGKLT